MLTYKGIEGRNDVGTRKWLLKLIDAKWEITYVKYLQIQKGKVNLESKLVLVETIDDRNRNDTIRFINNGKKFFVIYLGVLTTNAYENGFLKVNGKIRLYEANNKPLFKSKIVCANNNLVISFDDLENWIHF